MDICLIAGLPGSGKTTVIRRLSEALGQENCAGFFTSEMRERGRRTGFIWQAFSGETGVLADLKAGTPRVGKYRVVLDSFDRMLVTLRPSNDKTLLIDEVGKMECLSEKFRDLLSTWESFAGPRVFTVPTHGTPFIETFKRRHQRSMLQLTVANREKILAELISGF